MELILSNVIIIRISSLSLKRISYHFINFQFHFNQQNEIQNEMKIMKIKKHLKNYGINNIFIVLNFCVIKKSQSEVKKNELKKQSI